MGSFYAGGRPLQVEGRPIERLHVTDCIPEFAHDPNGLITVEQCYVQYFIPEECRGLPVVLVHGGGLCGTCWESTPDDRPGWVELLLQRHRSVYVIDMMERGRAGWCALPGVWPEQPIMRTAEEAWRIFRFGAAADFAGRNSFPGQMVPVDALPELIKRFVPRWPRSEERSLPALRSAIQRIGPCAIVGHSSAAGSVYRAAMADADVVRAVVMLEPSGVTEALADDLAGRIYGAIYGDYLDHQPMWHGLRLAVEALHEQLRSRGGQVRIVDLADEGLPGHSHMMMMDRGSERVLSVVLGIIGGASDPTGRVRGAHSVLRSLE